MGVALKTISNDTGHIPPNELDQVSIRELSPRSAPIPTVGPWAGAGESKIFEGGERKCLVA